MPKFEIKAKGVKVVFKSNVIYLGHLIRKEDKKKGYIEEFKEHVYSYYNHFLATQQSIRTSS